MPDENFVPPDLTRPPTPEEAADAYKQLKTQADLEAMLGEVEKLKGGKEVLGPDGQAIRSPEERQAAMQARLTDYRKQKIRELSNRMESLAKANPEFASCVSLLREANCLINLAFSEMSTLEGVDDELIGFSNEFMQHVTRSDPNDQLDDLIRRLKRNVIVFLQKKKFRYEKLMNKRKEAILGLAKLHPERAPVVVMTCLSDLGMNIPVMPMGMVYPVFSEGFNTLEEEAVHTVDGRLRDKGYHTILLSTFDVDKAISPKWWYGACDGERTLGEVLDPILTNRPKSQILIVSSLDLMLSDEKRQDPSPKNRQQALLRIVRWCLDNQVLGLVFSEGTAESRPWLGRSITLKKGAKPDVDGAELRDAGKPEVVQPDSDRAGPAVEGSGKDQG